MQLGGPNAVFQGGMGTLGAVSGLIQNFGQMARNPGITLLGVGIQTYAAAVLKSNGVASAMHSSFPARRPVSRRALRGVGTGLAQPGDEVGNSGMGDGGACCPSGGVRLPSVPMDLPRQGKEG